MAEGQQPELASLDQILKKKKKVRFPWLLALTAFFTLLSIVFAGVYLWLIAQEAATKRYFDSLREFENERYGDAVTELENFLVEFGKNRQVPNALYKLGVSNYHLAAREEGSARHVFFRQAAGYLHRSLGTIEQLGGVLGPVKQENDVVPWSRRCNAERYLAKTYAGLLEYQRAIDRMRAIFDNAAPEKDKSDKVRGDGIDPDYSRLIEPEDYLLLAKYYSKLNPRLHRNSALSGIDQYMDIGELDAAARARGYIERAKILLATEDVNDAASAGAELRKASVEIRKLATPDAGIVNEIYLYRGIGRLGQLDRNTLAATKIATIREALAEFSEIKGSPADEIVRRKHYYQGTARALLGTLDELDNAIREFAEAERLARENDPDETIRLSDVAFAAMLRRATALAEKGMLLGTGKGMESLIAAENAFLEIFKITPKDTVFHNDWISFDDISNGVSELAAYYLREVDVNDPGKSEKAVELLARLKEFSPGEKNSRYALTIGSIFSNLGMLMYNRGRREKADEYFTEAGKNYKLAVEAGDEYRLPVESRLDGYYGGALAFLAISDPDYAESEIFLTEFKKLAPYNDSRLGEVRYKLGEVRYTLGFLKEAAEVLEENAEDEEIRRHFYGPPTLFLLARVYKDMGKLLDARESLLSIIAPELLKTDTDPDKVEIPIVINPNTEIWIEASLELMRIYYGLIYQQPITPVFGDEKRRHWLLKEARDRFEKFIERHPRHPDMVELKYKYAKILESAAEYAFNKPDPTMLEHAITLYRDVIQLDDPNNPALQRWVLGAYLAIADIRYRHKQYTLSIEDYRALHTRFYDNPVVIWAFFQMANCYKNTGNEEMAERHYNQATNSIVKFPKGTFKDTPDELRRTDWENLINWHRNFKQP